MQPHQDGPAYFPVVAILSLGSPVVMDFTPHSSLKLGTNTVIKEDEDKFHDGGAGDFETERGLNGHHAFSVLLMPRSLLIFKDEAYSGGLCHHCFSLADNYKATIPLVIDMLFVSFPDYLHGIKDSVVHQYDGVR